MKNRFQISVSVNDGGELEYADTEREAVIIFCETLMEDATKYHQDYPTGTILAVVDREGNETILRYVVGYRSK